MKKIIFTILLLTLALLFTGCAQDNKSIRAKEYVKNCIEEFKNDDSTSNKAGNSDIAEIKRYFSDPAVAQQAGQDFGSLIFETVTDTLAYEIISAEKVNDTQVNVSTKIVAADMRKMINDYYSYMGNVISKNPKYAKMTQKELEKEAENILKEALVAFKKSVSRENRAIVTKTIDVVVTVPKDEKAECKIENSDELMDAMCGGLILWAEEMTKTLDDIQKQNGNKPIL